MNVHHRASCEVAAAQFTLGITTTSYAQVGENVCVPITAEVPGAWEVKPNCDVLGPQDLLLMPNRRSDNTSRCAMKSVDSVARPTSVGLLLRAAVGRSSTSSPRASSTARHALFI